MTYAIKCKKMVQSSHTHIRYKNMCRSRYHNMEIKCQQISSDSCNKKMCFTTIVINSVSTISAESPDVASESAINYFSNDQDYIEVDCSKTNKNERYSMQDPIKKCNDGNYTQLIITEDIAAYVFLKLKSQQVRPESQDDLKTDFVLLESM